MIQRQNDSVSFPVTSFSTFWLMSEVTGNIPVRCLDDMDRRVIAGNSEIPPHCRTMGC